MNKYDEARIFFLTKDTILPLLERKEKQALEEVLREFREGKQDLRGELARLDAYRSLIKEIHAKAKRHEAEIERQS